MIKPSEQPKLEHSLLVPQYFATLIEENNGTYIVDFAFNIKRHDIVTRNIKKLKIKLRKANYQETTQTIKAPSTSSAMSILTTGINNLQKAQTIESSIILEETIDLAELSLKYQDKRRQLQSFAPINPSSQIQKLRELQNDTFTLRDKNLAVIKNIRIDPSEAITNDSYKNESFVNSLLNHYLFYSVSSLPKDITYYSSLETNRKKPVLYLNHKVKIPVSYAKENIEVTFELYTDEQPNSLVFKERKTTFNIQNLIFYRNAKLTKPSIEEASNRLGVQGVRISQLDAAASGIQLQKKVINTAGFISNYSTIESSETSFKEKNSLSDNSFLDFVPVTNSISEIEIYRCVAYDSSTSSKLLSAYKNIVVGTVPYIDSTTMLISSNQAEKAVEINIQNVPPDALEFKILKRKFLKNSFGSGETLDNGKNVRPSEQHIELTRFLPTRPSPQRVLDTNVNPGDLYEYSVKYKLSNGLEKHSAFKVHKFVDSSKVKPIKVNISEVSTRQTNEGVSVSFNITGVSETEKNDLIVNALQQVGLDAVYQEEFQKIKDKFQDLVFYKVTRINLSVSPAIEEEFKDIVRDGLFVDNASKRSNSGIADIDLNYDYLYEIRAYYKNPISLLRDLVVTVPETTSVATGGTVKKGYSYKPYKWLQKRSLDSGTLPAETSTGDIIETSFIEDGDIGVVATLKIDRLDKFLEIKTAAAKRIDMQTISVNWKVESSLENYDHFVVVKQANKNRKIVVTTKDLRYIDTITREDVGTIIYYITPVYNNYEVGPTVRTGTIIVDPEELDGLL